LKGIKLSDFRTPEDDFESKLMENINDVLTTDMNSKYQANPSIFTTMETWIKSTKCHCWACAGEFLGEPIFIPSYIKKKEDGKIEMGTYGNFCSFNCAQKWINEKHKYDGTHDDKTRYLKILYEKFTGKKIQKIIESPDKTIMKQYCGDSGIEFAEYRKIIMSLNYDYDLAGYKLSQLKND